MEYPMIKPERSGRPTGSAIGTLAVKKKRENRRKIILIVVPLILIILILLGLAIAWYVRLHSCSKYCYTADCVSTSGDMLQLADMSVDPCKDFQEYACGKFSSKAIIKPESTSLMSYSDLLEETFLKTYKLLTDESSTIRGVNSTAADKVKRLFTSCMNIEVIEKQGERPLIKFIESIKGWPLLKGTDWNEDAWNLQEAIVEANKLGAYPFFSYSVMSNYFNSSEVDIKLLDAELTFANKLVYNKLNGTSNPFEKAFIKYISTVANLLGSTLNVSKEAEQIWMLEESMGMMYLVLAAEAPKTAIPEINRTTIIEANNLLGNWINLEQTFNEVFGRKVPPSDMVTIISDQYLRNIGDIVKKIDKRTQANYISWITLKRFMHFMSTPFQEAENAFMKVITGQISATPRWKTCTSAAIDSMGFAISGLFIEQYFVETAKKEVEYMFDLIKIIFEKKLHSASWLDDVTRREAVKKFQKMSKRIGYPEFITDPGAVDRYYEKFDVSINYFQNGVNIYKFQTYQKFAKYGQARDKNEWLMSPIDFNAYYDRSTNGMVILAGLLQQPIYSEVFPKSYNFGRIGFIIGHEIIHGFDSTGRLFNSDGNLVDWWSEKSRLEFNKRSQCFVRQYRTFEVLGLKGPENLTLAEDIADNGGLSLAYLSYKEWLKRNNDLLLPALNLTNEQLFFLSFGQYFCASLRKEKEIELLQTDVHSNYRIRILGTVQNSQSFAEAFNCPKNSPMNPETKCSIW